MELFALPSITVIDNGILPYLQWRDLLNLRLVSKKGQALVQSYLSTRSELVPELKIVMEHNGRWPNLDIFFKMNIPCSKIFLSELSHFNTEKIFSANAVIDQLHQRFGSVVTNFRASDLAIGSEYQNERRFWEGFVNLTELQAEQISFSSEFVTEEILLFAPSTFSKLKTLEIDNIQSNNYKGDVAKLVEDLLIFCPLLEHLALPYIPRTIQQLHPLYNGTCLNRILNCLVDISRKNGLPNLKTINFEHIYFSTRVNRMARNGELKAFLRLCQSTMAKNVRLLHVDGLWFREGPQLNLHLKLNLGTTVVSMRCLRASDMDFALVMNMPLLEEIEVFAWSTQNGVSNEWHPRLNWPRIKSLKITVPVVNQFAFQRVKSLFQLFFENDTFPTLHKAHVRFFPLYQAKVKKIPWHQLVESSSSLTKLTLESWRGPEKSLAKFCRGRNSLEQIILLNYDKRLEHIKFLVNKSGDRVLFNPKEYGKPNHCKKGLISSLISKSIRRKNTIDVPGPLELITAVGLRTLIKSGISMYSEMLVAEDQSSINSP